MADRLFKIDPGSTVKATRGGYYYCTTTPPHPHGEKRGDRKKKYVYLHRAKMEQHLGRYLKKNEQVDHKDGNKANNDLSNLVLKKRGPHQRDHALNGNKFWKHSPRTKPRKKKASQVMRVILSFLKQDET